MMNEYDAIMNLPVSFPKNPAERLVSNPWPRNTNDSSAVNTMIG
jgi:hypothetical protein